MWIFTRSLDELSEADLQFLLQNNIPESVTLEYKAEIYGGRDADIREMLRDVASIANAEGGAIVIGVEETTDGVASKLVNVPDADTQANRLISSCNASISERIPGLRARPIPFAQGQTIVVRIPRSYRRPHMITFGGATDFWIRHDRQKSRMSITEIRTAATATEELAMKVERFIEERQRAMRALMPGLLLGMTATPLLLEEGRVDIFNRRVKELVQDPPTYRSIEGVTLSNLNARVRPSLNGLRAEMDGFTRLDIFRNGHIEFVFLAKNYLVPEGNDPVIVTGWIVAELLMNLALLVRAFREVTNITDPYLFALSMWRCRGVAMLQSGGPLRSGARGGSQYTESEDLVIGPVVASADESPDTTARTLADRFWNAFHFMRCPFFNVDGKFQMSS